MRRAYQLVSIILIGAFVTSCLPCPIAAEAAVVGQSRVYVLGAVNKPGDFEFEEGMEAKDVLEAAGGIANSADPNGATLIRGDKVRIDLNLDAVMKGEDSVPLQAGDTLILRPGIVRVEGQVQKPGRFDVFSKMTVADAIAEAGGVLEAADKTSVNVARDGKNVQVDLTAAESPEVHAGDIITVPEMTVVITGEVAAPGAFSLTSGETDNLDAIITKAGGATAKADLKNVQISGVRNGEYVTTTVNASDKAARAMITLQNGDTIFVPEMRAPRKKVSLNDIYLITGILYTLVRIFKD